MKINVINKTEKLLLGPTYELRGNFKKQIDEDGNTTYSCDMFRTKDKTKTFDELYQAEKRIKNIQYLADTKYVDDNYTALLKVDSDKAKQYYESVSDTYHITVKAILEERARVVEELATF